LPIAAKKGSKPKAIRDKVSVRPAKPAVMSTSRPMRRIIKIALPIGVFVCLLIFVFIVTSARRKAQLVRKAKATLLTQLAEEGYIICGDLALTATDIYNAYYRNEESAEVWVKARNLSKDSILLDSAYFALVIGDQRALPQAVKERYSLDNTLVAPGQETSAVIFFDYVELKDETVPTGISLIFKDKWKIPLKELEVR
jgi:hypothetical protein